MGYSGLVLLTFPILIMFIAIAGQGTSFSGTAGQCISNPNGTATCTTIATSGTLLSLTSCYSYGLSLLALGINGGTATQASLCTSEVGITPNIAAVIIGYQIDATTALACNSQCNSVLFFNQPTNILGSTPAPSGAAAYATCQIAGSGYTCTLYSTIIQGTGGTNTNQYFSFGSSISGNFTILLVAAAGLTAIAGIAILGSGENAESIHILFVIGLILTIWTFLTVLEGYGSAHPSNTEYFSQLNKVGFQLGTIAWGALTLMITLGGIGAVTRGD